MHPAIAKFVKRGPEPSYPTLPRVDDVGRTSVTGLFVVGDAAGTPLLKLGLNAGARCADAIADELAAAPPSSTSSSEQPEWDVAVVGGGAAGLACAARAQRRGLRALIVEGQELAQTVVSMTKGKHIFAEPLAVKNESDLWLDETTREGLLERWRAFVTERKLDVRTHAQVEDVKRVSGPAGSAFDVVVAGGERIRARRVVVAVGKSGSPRKAGVPGEAEHAERISHGLADADAVAGQRVLVYGGGDVACEAALALCERNTVTLATIDEALTFPKKRNRDAVLERAAAGKIELRLATKLGAIHEGAVVLEGKSGPARIPNDLVYEMIGADPPIAFFKKLGLALEGAWTLGRVAVAVAVFVAVYALYALKKFPETPYAWPFTSFIDVNGFQRVVGGAFDVCFAPFSWAFSTEARADIARTTWFQQGYLYSLAYTLAMIVFGAQALLRWTSVAKNPKYQRWRYASLITFQIVFFLVANVVAVQALSIQHSWRAWGLYQPWPLFFHTFHWWNASDPQVLKWAFIGAGLAGTFIAIPLASWKHGKRFCTWVCGCGGLAETLGDRWRHLAPKGKRSRAWEVQGLAVLVAAAVVTLVSVGMYQTRADNPWAFAYSYIVDFWLVAVIPIALYPFFGGKIWCRYWCPLAAWNGVLAKWYGKLGIESNDQCISCGQCSKQCQVGVDVMQFARNQERFDNGNSSCIHCGICIDVCPVDVLKFSTKRTSRSLPIVGAAALLALSSAAATTACEPGLAPLGDHRCRAPSRALPTFFLPCDVGSGVFGAWTVDDTGLPAYRYTLDQRGDERARWTLSDGSVRRDHLFQIGNGRVIGVVDTDGFAQIFMKDRGPTFLNRVDRFAGPGNIKGGGGYSWIVEDDGAAWCTAFALARATTQIERSFGLQRAVQTAIEGDLVVTHTLSAPPSPAPGVRAPPFVVDEVRITNLGPRRTLRHVEVWDANRHYLELQLLRSGSLSPDVPRDADAARDALNADYTVTAFADGVDGGDGGGTGDAMRLRWTSTKPASALSPRAGPALVDDHPDDIFLARLHGRGGRFWTDRAAFFGAGGAAAPDGVFGAGANTPLPEEGVNGAGAPAVLVDEVVLDMDEGETEVLRWAFGAVAAGAPLAIPAELAAAAADDDDDAGDDGDDGDRSARSSLAERERGALVAFVTEGAAPLQREMAWHAAQLRGSVAYDASFDAQHTVQGSAYQYLHGLDGAARDYALFAVPLAYVEPALARENLRMIMRMTHADTRQISYATAGFGMAEDAVVHSAPSDLDLFFLWALAEYVVVTGDRAFLDEVNPYWPRGSGALADEPTRAHARRAVRHLIDDVGVGAHGLLRVRTGDWSDGIVFRASDRQRAVDEGESIPNSQMATWVLPVAAGALFGDAGGDDAGDDQALADEMRAFAASLRGALAGEVVDGAGWYRRARFGGDERVGDDEIELEAQVWALIGNVGGDGVSANVSDAVFALLDEPSAVGAPLARGNDVWHAITGLLTWGYASRAQHERAWRSFVNDTMTSYTRANRDAAQWYGIWSGPDGIGPDGGTWLSGATPTTDWPVMNGNQHAMPLLALLRVSGLEPADDGALHWRAPSVPGAFTLALPTLRIDVDDDGAVSGELRLLTDGERVLVIDATGERVVARGFAGDVVRF